MTVLADVSGEQYYVDPRLPIECKKCTYTSTDPKNIRKGTIAGCTVDEQTTCDPGTSWINYEMLCRKDAPVTYMDYAEVELILSEAAQRGLVSGSANAAKAYYEAGHSFMREMVGFGGCLQRCWNYHHFRPDQDIPQVRSRQLGPL